MCGDGMSWTPRVSGVAADRTVLKPAVAVPREWCVSDALTARRSIGNPFSASHVCSHSLAQLQSLSPVSMDSYLISAKLAVQVVRHQPSNLICVTPKSVRLSTEAGADANGRARGEIFITAIDKCTITSTLF
ncbi:hypothetical protein CBL_09090 [Carabus blaptoides fortunei]